MISDIYAYWF